jgi:hypothetical protein
MLLILAGVAGCTHRSDYSAPIGLTSVTGATIVGSATPSRVSLLPGTDTAYVTAIDAHVVRGPLLFSDPSLLVAPGHHTIQIAVDAGVGSAELGVSVELEQGKTYVVRSQAEGAAATLWIEDQITGLPASRRATLALNAPPQGGTTVIFVPHGK